MRVALMIEGQEGVSWSQWCGLADACEEHGVETLFRSDHYISQSNESGNVAHDAWTTLAGLAARTTTLRFGTLVSPVTFRLPALLANAAATADHVSAGRIELGLGAGWMEREHRAYGFPFPETSTRVAMFAEQLEIVHRLWTEDRVTFQGEHYTLDDAPAQPKPLAKPRIIVGGSGNRWGAIAGGVLVAYLPERFRAFADYRYFVFGLALMTLAIWRPEGLLPPRRTRRAKAVEAEIEALEEGALDEGVHHG